MASPRDVAIFMAAAGRVLGIGGRNGTATDQRTVAVIDAACIHAFTGRKLTGNVAFIFGWRSRIFRWRRRVFRHVGIGHAAGVGFTGVWHIGGLAKTVNANVIGQTGVVVIALSRWQRCRRIRGRIRRTGRNIGGHAYVLFAHFTDRTTATGGAVRWIGWHIIGVDDFGITTRQNKRQDQQAEWV